jgi:hypothetical protein
MGGFFRTIFSNKGRIAPAPAPCQPLPAPVDTDLDRSRPVDTDADQFATHCPVPTRRWVPPQEHAVAILEFLQGPGGRTGSIPYGELKNLHLEICWERDWEPVGWNGVGRELRRLLKDEKTYDKRRRVYHIPPVSTRARIRAVY